MRHPKPNDIVNILLMGEDKLYGTISIRAKDLPKARAAARQCGASMGELKAIVSSEARP